ncbi:WD40-repeat-containing domain protein [Bombardia bombarda]|uniref:WD40-repeat-containing domain protein n=1 Tax=Bombardia bombarda TaxID=252184 RepID=A0AA39XQC5_9PEZI|nr:WD40-repeat-containing domain protein [Bombardia bombarda]
MADGPSRRSTDLPAKITSPVGDVFKDKSKRGSSFLSRLSMRGNKRKDGGDPDSDSELGGEARMDGTNARVFSQAVTGTLAGGGYIPHHKEPPRYIRTKAHHKKTREFNRVFLAQELVGTKPPKKDGDEVAPEASRIPVVTVSVSGASGRKETRTGGAIWATEFSKDGKYLAAAGRDHVVRIWAVISTPEERRAHEEEEVANGGSGERLSAPVFRDKPICEFEGHTGEVLDLSWSKNNFLLSSSMDKTVRLWHISRTECLCTFKHKDFVTRLAFHPRDDRFFLAGSLDTMLRLWSIPDKAIAFSAPLPDLITAVAFTPDGKTAIAGLLNGLCLFYETEGLKLQTQIHVRSSRGKNAKGSKITGIQTMNVPPSHGSIKSSQARNFDTISRTSTDLGRGETKVLITSNDSRIRVYNLRDKSLDIKLKGHDNACSQIAACFSDDGKYVICGSEDRKAFIWNLSGDEAAHQDKDKSPCEYFEAHGDMVTTAVFAPTKTRMLLGQSGDPLYDLCNPPPVTLRSLEETASAAVSQTELSHEEQQQAPVVQEQQPVTKRPEQTPAYIARSTHYDGNIIVTTDDSGIIKVFRQDCAYSKRRHDHWETGSTFSRKLSAHGGGFIASGLGRSISIMTKTSASGSAAHSRRGSLSQSLAPSGVISPQLGPIVTNSSDRILSWRQGIEPGGDKRHSGLLNGGTQSIRTERSMSPTKATRSPLSPNSVNMASEARRQPYAGATRSRGNSVVASPTASVFSNTPERTPARPLFIDMAEEREKDMETDRNLKEKALEEKDKVEEDTEKDSDELPTDTGGTGFSFWNLNRWRNLTGFGGGSNTSGGGGGQGRGRQPIDGVAIEDAKEKEKNKPHPHSHSRNRSMGVFTSITSGVGSSSSADDTAAAAAAEKKKQERKSLPPPKHERQGNRQMDGSAVPTIVHTPVDADAADDDDDDEEGEEDERGTSRGLFHNIHPLQVLRDNSPYRHLWSRGNLSTVSRQSSELSDSDEEEDHERGLRLRGGEDGGGPGGGAGRGRTGRGDDV